MFGIGSTELLILAIIGLLLFGKRLPDIARGLGRSLAEVKRGMASVAEDVQGTLKP